MFTLVLGGARSGKSRFAESLCAGAHKVAYIATLRPEDDEMRERVARHRSDRSSEWLTIEEPLDIAGAAERCAAEYSFILLDCLTLWLSNLCDARRQDSAETLRAAAAQELARLVNCTARSQCVVVTNEVGCGVVPASPLGRVFRDLQGWVNQDAARAADWVYHVVAGIPVALKRPGAAS
ncbi:MAG TPA: bifunctional adenosylcobinamide kinase/adenosylcobinamide-phosphate guanylyltransferase [Bryobacteraceae bacterium]|nr:bifunctional adenosylcobinamide kinase/adenosylcobinamide-phosphate guanylyltransferase [Bryobacteraceae bacterium]